jgi:rubrerythrin
MSKKPAARNLLETLKIALRMEAEGKKLFVEAAEKATGRHARQTFEFLAAEEDRHMEHIRQFYAALEADGVASVPRDDVPGTDQRLKDFNQQLVVLREDLKPTESDVDAFRFALKFENGAEDFYREQIETSDNESVRAFFAWLVNEEELHGRVLTSCLKFAEDPASWFQERDGGVD